LLAGEKGFHQYPEGTKMKSGTASEIGKIALCVALVLVLIFVVPIIVYGTLSSLIGLQVPGDSAITFLTGVFISKTGTAIAFVALFYIAHDTFSGRWFLYAFVWWMMFAFGEVGQAIGPNYSWEEALGGVLSETIYLPLSAFLIDRLFKA
jgi:hypothetical protein